MIPSVSADGPVRTLWQEFSVPFRFPVMFTRNIFNPESDLLADIVSPNGTPTPVFAALDEGVADADLALPRRLEEYGRDKGLRLVAPVSRFPGGERCKDGPEQVERFHRLFLEHRLCRHSVVVAIGGGAFLDVAGYAAATAHRGIRLLRLPTTTLAQNDAGIGVKNGYNAFGRKNWVGTFTPPLAVINDLDFLRTLPPREARAGMAEAVKVAVIKDRSLFRFLADRRRELALFEDKTVEEMVIRCATLHLRHIAGGDPFEQGSARPLDFGHWVAHALEEATGGELLHGEAVALGIALDAEYAREKGLLSARERDEIGLLLRDLGFALAHPALATLDLEEALERFRQHLGGTLTVTLPAGIGHRVEVGEIDIPLLHRCRDRLMSV